MATKKNAAPRSRRTDGAPASANASDELSITSVLHEERVFPPSETFSSEARVGSLKEYKRRYKRA